jgi:L-lactate dehydrogenase complex protein LldF
MRHWREQEFERHLTPKAMRYGIGLWAFFARRPFLYRFGTSLAARALALIGRRGERNGRFRSLPLAGGWTRYRDFPAPESGGSFMARWQAGKRE